MDYNHTKGTLASNTNTNIFMQVKYSISDVSNVVDVIYYNNLEL